MLKKSVGIVAAALAFGVFGVLANGCSSSSTTSNPTDGGGGDAKKDTGTGGGGDSGPGTGDPPCFDPTSVLTFNTAPAAPKANQGKCPSDAIVSAFVTACLTSGDAGETDAGDAACEAYLNANNDCALCLAGFGAPDAAAPTDLSWPALGQVDQTHVLPAVAVCIAALSTGTDECKSNYANDNLCTESGCSANCSDADFTGCATAETTDPTSTCLTANPLDAACIAAINGVSQTDADSKCGASTTISTDTDFDNVFLEVGRTLCE